MVYETFEKSRVKFTCYNKIAWFASLFYALSPSIYIISNAVKVSLFQSISF